MNFSRRLKWLLLVVVTACSSAADLPVSSTTSTTAVPFATSRTTSTMVPDPQPTKYVVWTSGGLTEAMVTGLEATFDVLSIVAGDAAPMDIGDGQVVPMDAIGLDVDDHSWFDTAGETRVLRPGTILLGATSAEFREAGVGDVLSFGDVDFEVAGVVSDDVLGAAEVVFAKDDPDSPVSTPRYALIPSFLELTEFEATVEALNDAPVPVRVTAEADTPLLRHADGVLPQIFIKLALGEFSYPADSGPQLEQDQQWVEDNIVTAEVPILGNITCHRVVVDMAIDALKQVVDEGLEDLVDPDAFAGCWNARFVRTVTGEPSGVSRHSWGAALDINAPTNRMGTEGDMDMRLVEIMREWGFLWGGDWSVPDPMHFEFAIQPGD